MVSQRARIEQGMAGIGNVKLAPKVKTALSERVCSAEIRREALELHEMNENGDFVRNASSGDCLSEIALEQHPPRGRLAGSHQNACERRMRRLYPRDGRGQIEGARTLDQLVLWGQIETKHALDQLVLNAEAGPKAMSCKEGERYAENLLVPALFGEPYGQLEMSVEPLCMTGESGHGVRDVQVHACLQRPIFA
jgi:hypothetical protein